MKGLPISDQNDILKKFDTLEVTMVNLTKLLLTISAVSFNSNSPAVNSINFNRRNPPGKINSKIKR